MALFYAGQSIASAKDAKNDRRNSEMIREWKSKHVDLQREKELREYVISNYAEAYEKAVKYKYEMKVLEDKSIPRDIYSIFCVLEGNCGNIEQVLHDTWCMKTLVSCLLWMEGKVHSEYASCIALSLFPLAKRTAWL